MAAASVTPAVLAKAKKPAAIGSRNVYSVKKQWSVAVGGFGKATAVSRTSNRVLVATDKLVAAFDFWSGKRAGRLAACRDVVRGGLEVSDGRVVVVCESALQIFDATTLAKMPGPAIAKAAVTAAAIASPRIALGHGDGVVRVYSLSGEPTVEIPIPGPPIDVKSLALSKDGTRLAVAWVQGSIWLWKTAQPTTPLRLVRHSNESDAVVFNEDGSSLAEEGEPRQTTVWSLSSSPRRTLKIRNGDWVKRLLFTRDSKWLVRGGSDGLELAEIGGPKRVALDTSGEVEDVSTDELGASLAAVDRKGVASLWMPR